MLSSLYLPLVLLGAAVGAGFGLLAWLHRGTPGARPLSLFLFSVSLWAATEGLSLAAPGLETVTWATVKYTVGATIPLAWLLTVVEYAGLERWLRLRVVAVLSIEPLLFIGLLWTNGAHQYVWETTDTVAVGPYTAFVAVEGLAFWGHMIYTYLVIVIGATVLLRMLVETDGLFRSQATALLAAIALPMIVNALVVFDVLQLPVDPTGVMFILSGAVLVGAMLRGQLLEVSPAARELGRQEVVTEMDDPVIIVDSGGRVVDANRAAVALLPDLGDTGRPLADVQPALAGALGDGDALEEITFEADSEVRYYDASVSPFRRAGGAVGGYVVSLRDVTERTRREQRLDVMNRLFRHNLRNEMNVVRGNAELLAGDIDDPALRERADRIIDTVDEVIDRGNKVGALSRSLEGAAAGPVALSAVVDSAVASVRREYPDAVISVEGAPDLAVEAGSSLEIVLRELLLNAVEHGRPADTARADGTSALDDRSGAGDPEPVRLDATVDGGTIALRVSDDGPGVPDQELSVIDAGVETPLHHGSGIGLWMVTWLVERVGGTIEFDTGDGTTVTVSVPLARPDAEE